MSKTAYLVTDGGVAKKIKKKYMVMDGGLTRKIKKKYITEWPLDEPLLPEGFTRLTYVESGGKAWFNTDFKPNQNTKVELDFRLTSTATHVFGARSDYMDRAFCVCWLSDMPFVIQIANKTYSAGEFDTSAHYHLEMTASSFKLNGETKATYSVDDFQCVENMWLFSCPNGSETENSSGYIYGCKVYDGSTLVRNYVPARNASGVVGFYDHVNGTFGGSMTGTAFSGGEEIKPVTRLIYSNTAEVSYSGAYTVAPVRAADGVFYDLYTLTGSGILTVSGDVECWLCGGGGTGGAAADGLRGGGGGYADSAALSTGTYVVTIGAGGTTSNNDTAANNGNVSRIETDDAVIATADGGQSGGNGGNGGCGGGGGRYKNSLNDWIAAPGQGAGKSTIPFGIESLNPHCAGGSGGVMCVVAENIGGRYNYVGGDGGSDGSNGTAYTERAAVIGEAFTTNGGYKGGGYIYFVHRDYNANSPSSSVTWAATRASFYGAGASGNYTCQYGNGNMMSSSKSPGYQGVVYLLV